jgi:hypothetical protein
MAASPLDGAQVFADAIQTKAKSSCVLLTMLSHFLHDRINHFPSANSWSIEHISGHWHASVSTAFRVLAFEMAEIPSEQEIHPTDRSNGHMQRLLGMCAWNRSLLDQLSGKSFDRISDIKHQNIIQGLQTRRPRRRLEGQVPHQLYLG